MPLRLTRRDFVKTAAIAAAVSSVPLTKKIIERADDREAILSPADNVKFVNTFCYMCAALCGVQIAVRDGKPIYITPVDGSPQRGMCGRSASGMWLWDHPLRVRKPLKRIGEKGEGKFQEISWDQALNEIAAKLREITDKYGPRAVAFTWHEHGLEFLDLFRFALGTCTFANHLATCNLNGTIARRANLGALGPPAVEPDLENATYVLLIGRTYSTANMGHVNALRSSDKVKIVYVGPRLAEIAYGKVEWIPIKPATDVVLVLSLIHVIIEEGLYDVDFLKRYTNAPFLIKPDRRPLVEADVVAGGSATRYLVFDARTGKLEDHTRATDPDLTYSGEVKLADGSTIRVTTAFNLLRERAAKYSPAEAEKITGVPAHTIRRIAREFATHRGVADDTWWTVWNGIVDTYAVMAVLILNMLVGSYERPGGLCFPVSRRYPAIGSTVSEGGTRYWRPIWATTIPEARPGLPEAMWGAAMETRIDLRKYPATVFNFHPVYDAILKDDPYPVRALFTFATDPMTRDMDVETVREALKKLELFVAFDVLMTDSAMYADYILPDTIYMERDLLVPGKWSLHAHLQKQNKAVDPPPGCEARDMLWAFMEIIRRAWPEKAKALGWKDEYSDYNKYLSEFLPKMEEAILRRVAAEWAADLKMTSDELYARMDKELKEKGYFMLMRKTYSQAGLANRPTPSRKLEIYAIRNLTDGLDPLPDYVPPAYTLPKGPDEFYFVTGKGPLVSVHATLMNPMKWLLDSAVWMNPKDAERLGIRDGDEIEIEAIDTGRKVRAKVKITDKVVEGALFTYAQSRGRRMVTPSGLEWTKEGFNPNSLIKITGFGRVGVGACNCSVRVKKVS